MLYVRVTDKLITDIPSFDSVVAARCSTLSPACKTSVHCTTGL